MHEWKSSAGHTNQNVINQNWQREITPKLGVTSVKLSRKMCTYSKEKKDVTLITGGPLWLHHVSEHNAVNLIFIETRAGDLSAKHLTNEPVTSPFVRYKKGILINVNVHLNIYSVARYVND